MLSRWWKAGWCVAGLLYASARHPDRHDRLLGALLTRSRDPLAVLGARLRPWHGQLAQLPAGVIGHRMPEPARLQPARAEPARSAPPTPHAGTRVRDEAQADIRAQLQAITARVAARKAAQQPAPHQPRLLPRHTPRRRT
jgi:hypothetical protein